MGAVKATSFNLLAPFQRAPVSGVYRVHHDQHRSEHLVTVVEGDEFPRCRKCQAAVRFQLWMEVEYVARDWDLSGPNLRLLDPTGVEPAD